MTWLLRATMPATTAEPVMSLLWDMGTSGIAEEPAAPDSLAPGAGATVVTLVAGFDTELLAHKAAEALATPSFVAVSDVKISPYAWTGSSEATTVELPGTDQRLSITAGSLFGHGGHATTGLALALMSSRFRPGCRVLDVGTGSGVLALAAAAYGSGEIVAVDIDPDAAQVVSANRETNGSLVAEASIEVVIGRAADLPHLLVGRSLPFDLVLANMLLPAHRELAPHLPTLLGAEGELITAGTLATDHLDLLDLYCPPLTATETVHEGDWAGYRFRFAD